jgi:hypothetical protein
LYCNRAPIGALFYFGEALEPLERQAAKERQEERRGRPKNGEKFTPFIDGGKALDKVASAVGMRRHLNESQRAVIAAKLANMKRTDTLKQNRSANLQNGECEAVSQSTAAELLNVSPRLVATVKAVERAVFSTFNAPPLHINVTNVINVINVIATVAFWRFWQALSLSILTSLTSLTSLPRSIGRPPPSGACEKEEGVFSTVEVAEVWNALVLPLGQKKLYPLPPKSGQSGHSNLTR